MTRQLKLCRLWTLQRRKICTSSLKLLNNSVSRVNLETGIYEPSNQGINEEALIRLAEVLSKEKRLREEISQLDHKVEKLKQLNFYFYFCKYRIKVVSMNCVNFQSDKRCINPYCNSIHWRCTYLNIE